MGVKSVLARNPRAKEVAIGARDRNRAENSRMKYSNTLSSSLILTMN